MSTANPDILKIGLCAALTDNNKPATRKLLELKSCTFDFKDTRVTYHVRKPNTSKFLPFSNKMNNKCVSIVRHEMAVRSGSIDIKLLDVLTQKLKLSKVAASLIHNLVHQSFCDVHKIDQQLNVYHYLFNQK